MLPNYYKIFEISKSSTKEEIKKRYRELAKKYHPDVNQNSDATSKMQEIQEAYYILYDDEARGLYDIQYDRIYGIGDKLSKQFSQNETNQDQNKYSAQTENINNDPILEKWILNARIQALEFVTRLYRDTKGITKSGCMYYFKALGICSLIFIVVLIILSIIRFFKT